MDIEETCYGICLQCDKASHLDKKLLLPGLLDGWYVEWTGCVEPTEKWMLNFPKDETVLQGFFFTDETKLPDILQDTEESDWQTVNIGKTVFQISCFMKKSARYYGPVS